MLNSFIFLLLTKKLWHSFDNFMDPKKNKKPTIIIIDMTTEENKNFDLSHDIFIIKKGSFRNKTKQKLFPRWSWWWKQQQHLCCCEKRWEKNIILVVVLKQQQNSKIKLDSHQKENLPKKKFFLVFAITNQSVRDLQMTKTTMKLIIKKDNLIQLIGLLNEWMNV